MELRAASKYGFQTPGQSGGDIAVMLEKIEMAPGELLEVVGLAQHPTDRAGYSAPRSAVTSRKTS